MNNSEYYNQFYKNINLYDTKIYELEHALNMEIIDNYSFKIWTDNEKYAKFIQDNLLIHWNYLSTYKVNKIVIEPPNFEY